MLALMLLTKQKFSCSGSLLLGVSKHTASKILVIIDNSQIIVGYRDSEVKQVEDIAMVSNSSNSGCLLCINRVEHPSRSRDRAYH